ncbi:MAG TPA: hypothetical protein VHE30_10395 [Polyangiaceae bacterium]|nr:hypothetical protein [Polyangiaceae bacterium]
MARVAPFLLGALFCGNAAAAPEPADERSCELLAYGADGARLDPGASWLSLSRTVPGADDPDPDATTWMVACIRGVPPSLSLDSFRPDGTPLDALHAVRLSPARCPPDVPGGRACAATDPIRATMDLVDRAYPAVAGRSLSAEVGGAVVASAGGANPARLAVGAPRELPGGGRHRGDLRFHVVRIARHGEPAVGGDDAGAVRVARSEARIASRVWGQCGIHFGPEAEVPVEVVDPPPRNLLAVGCDLGLPAAGTGRLAVVVDGTTIAVSPRQGEPPVVVATEFARAARAAGFRAEVSDNARIASGAMRTADVAFRTRDGAPAHLAPPKDGPLSTDGALTACLAEFAPADGLTHFDDQDAAAGTLEERALVKAYADDDPRTIDVFIVPSFARTGRIGESFIDGDGSAIQNVVIIDRGAVRAGARSHALAHELGHILMDLPGHPDDFGVDQPFSLMDADAADATVFGPRRLSREDCARALLQSGPGAEIPLLRPWPLHPGKAGPATPGSPAAIGDHGRR